MQPMASGGGHGATGMRRGYREGIALANQNASITMTPVLGLPGPPPWLGLRKFLPSRSLWRQC
jgi:hypothetical protein